jgi:hypothetical protein
LEKRIKALCRKALGTLFDVLKHRERDIILMARAIFQAGLKEIFVTSGRLAVINK